MKRRLNFTDRRRITRDHVSIRMPDAEPGKPLKAKANVRLDGLNFPADALVVIEAYTRSTGQRFECGRVGSLSVPSPLVLDEVDRDAAVTFRVRVVDMSGHRGRILGAAEKLRPLSADEDKKERGRSLLPIQARDLGQEMWKVDVGDAGPLLLVNVRVPGLRDRLRSEPELQALILSAALRAVLCELVVDASEEEDAEEDWKRGWLHFCREMRGVDGDPSRMDSEQRRTWIDEVVGAFCERHRFVDCVPRMIGVGDSDVAAA